MSKSVNKPEPKAELIVTGYMDLSSALCIYVASEDAREWIEKETGQFGVFFRPHYHGDHYRLFVSLLYDVKEVKVYLESYLHNTTEK